MKTRGSRFAALLLSIIAAWSVPAGWADEVTYWNDVALDILKDGAVPPPKVGRDLAIIQSSVYDASNAIDRTYAPLYYQPSVSGPASQEAAVAAAAHRALVSLYPLHETHLDEILDARLAAIPDGAARDAGVAVGREVADRMVASRASDGWDQGYIDKGSAAPGQWRPTPSAYGSGLTPQWGSVDPFAISRSEDFVPGPPPSLDSQAYAKAVEEVRRLGAADSTLRTANQTQIANFWSDLTVQTATPPGKWNLIAQTLGEQQGNTLAENARMMALLNIALADTGIVCWDTKYTYDLWRPETAIHLADADGNPATQADPDWTPVLPSPPFPEYNSGHSSFSGAAAEVLALFFGTDDIAFDTGAGFDILPGVTRHYDSLSDAAWEAGRSRVYAGIHFEFSNFTGMQMGQAIALYVYENFAQLEAAETTPAPGALLLALAGLPCLLGWRRHSRG